MINCLIFMWIWPDFLRVLSCDPWKKLYWQHTPSPKETKETHSSRARAPACPGNASSQDIDTAHLQKTASEDVQPSQILTFLLISCYESGSDLCPVLADVPDLTACVPLLPWAGCSGHSPLPSQSHGTGLR